MAMFEGNLMVPPLPLYGWMCFLPDTRGPRASLYFQNKVHSPGGHKVLHDNNLSHCATVGFLSYSVTFF